MPALTNRQEERLRIIKNGLNEQLRAIQIDKLASPAEQSKNVEFLHDGLETQFNNYLDAVAQYLKAKNIFTKTDVIGK
ncbi:TPA: hypothetical protein ACTXXA_000101 [Legionella anisa]